MNKNERTVRILGLLLILAGLLLVALPYAGWVSTGQPAFGWNSFADCFGPRNIFTPYDGPWHRLTWFVALSIGILTMCYRRWIMSLTLTLFSGFYIVGALRDLPSFHPLGFSALVCFFLLSFLLFSSQVRSTQSNEN